MTAMFTADDILEVTSGKLVQGNKGSQPGRLVWNIEDITQGDWFVAMANGKEDSHDYLSNAFERGAQGSIVNKKCRYSFAPKEGSLIAVADTELALLDLANFWCRKKAKKVVTVSGTTGRKDTINLMEFLLRRDNRIHTAFEEPDLRCIPDVLAMPEDTDILIVEISGIGRGDIAGIASSIAPDLAVITSTHHPIPSKVNSLRAIAVNLEILESVVESDGIMAVVYDKNPEVKERAELILQDLKAIYYSTDTRSFSETSLNRLVSKSGITQTETRVDVSAWCALTAAICCGFSPEENPHIVSELIVSAG